MRILIVFTILLTSCSTQTEQKEKELPSYFCNENLEKYFAGNDSLATIELNNDFRVTKKSLDSINSDLYDFFGTPINIPIQLGKNSTHFLLKVIPSTFIKNINKKALSFNKRNLLFIESVSNESYLIDGKAYKSNLRKHIFDFITNYGRDVDLSDNPEVAFINFHLNDNVTPKFFAKTANIIIESYVNVLNETSNSKFNKSFCELNEKQSEIITNIIPYRFTISYLEDDMSFGEPSSFTKM